MEGLNPGNQYITAKVFGAKYKSKAEIFRFLTVEYNCYLPPHKVLTLYFLRSLISGEKNVGKILLTYFSKKVCKRNRYTTSQCSLIRKHQSRGDA